ncbi:uncharacterized protein PHACADRAFT_263766 [Phanerochaete carnosa HHB-10118-sp]|uniref:Protein kinase domain-containing protein n=1 Tax=Phanerochaete carnosa (strain HHB-10118-sp) TaxID=650164 RepID=K5VV62_PHACS|nr:uncharacterized protein PHACADRAFT_263766 [Phanerochaete carnosa HHB-10118-sp]EKM50459.1 hypothetical protein PHACADRAFT_263766 [Phanerochaete carnosa HHB-10118-sp]
MGKERDGVCEYHPGGLTGLGAGGEERERRHFGEALRDGYVLCQLANKLHPGLISRVDKREDGFVRTSNVTKFLAACSSLGVPPEELFHRDDLIESTPDSMARVAKSIMALLRVTEFPSIDKSKFIQGQGSPVHRSPNNPYGHGTLNRAAASTPNLGTAQRSVSPPTLGTPRQRKRISPPHPTLPTVRSDSPNESDSEGSKTAGHLESSKGPSDSEADDVYQAPRLPSRTPLRPKAAVAADRTSVADSTRASVGDSIRASLADSLVPSSAMRQSTSSSQMTDTTGTSSLLDLRSRRNSESQNSRFGTLRTMTTEATSYIPSENTSLSQTDAKFLAEEMSRWRSAELQRPPRERRPSETAVADLTRVIEEVEDSSTSAKAASRTRSSNGNGSAEPAPQRPKLSAIRMGKGKWPDDFLDAFPAQREPSTAFLDEEDLRPPSPLSQSPRPLSPPASPLSISPPRKLVLGGASRSNGSVESLPQFSRRPSHRSRHSVDTPGLLSKSDVLHRGDSSPDGSGVSGSPRIMLRRSSTRAGPMNRNGIYIPRNDSEDPPPPSDDTISVPFPSRRASGEASPIPSQAVHFSPDLVAKTSSGALAEERPRMPRGRFQSEIDGSSSRRRPRPQSFDDSGARPRRSRFESMVNLGAASGTASASDLMPRNEGSAVRQTLIVKEDGKLSTQFQLGNCIGRGQFGAVYRALNLNTGQMVAVKRIGLDGLKEEEISQLMKEVDLVKSLSHPSIVKYEGMARDENTLSIVLEYAENGSLGQTLKAFGKLNERLVAGYVVKILEGLHYLHQSDVVHCDLKAANILTTKNGNVKLSDFGVSLNLRAMEREMKDVAGTPNWMAPEVIELKGASTKSDIWSLGCTVIELLTGRPPYGEIANTMSVMFRIVEDDMPPLPDSSSGLLKDFLRQCFHKDPGMRPNAEDLCEHEWLRQNWAAHNKEIRPQDSIPFLRRVSADLQKSEVIKYLAKVEMPELDRVTPRSTPEIAPQAPISRRLSHDTLTPRDHTFVKTTFAKPVICRVCHSSVKKNAVLCESCSLICHTRCSHNAPPTCDLRAQLLLYAQYAENGTPNSAFSNPLEFLAAHSALHTPPTPMSDAGMSSRTSVDASVTSYTTPPHSPPPPHHPPTAFKVLKAFKRSRSSLNNHNDTDQTSTSSPSRNLSRKTSILRRNPPPPVQERPSSIASSSTSPPSSSLRSAVTAESFQSRPETVRRSAISIVETDVSVGERTDHRLSRMTSFSGVSMVDTEDARSFAATGETFSGTMRDSGKRREAKGDKSGCLVQ